MKVKQERNKSVSKSGSLTKNFNTNILEMTPFWSLKSYKYFIKALFCYRNIALFRNVNVFLKEITLSWEVGQTNYSKR